MGRVKQNKQENKLFYPNDICALYLTKLCSFLETENAR